MAKSKKRQARKRYSADQKAKILETANKEKLTAGAVDKRFGVKPATYYSWRKASKVYAVSGPRRGRPPKAAGIPGSVRLEVQRRVRDLLPEIVRQETRRYLDEVLKV